MTGKKKDSNCYKANSHENYIHSWFILTRLIDFTLP